EFRRKLLCIGDPLCGKTCLLRFVISSNYFRCLLTVTTAFQNYICNVSIASMTVEFAFYDTNGVMDYDRIRPMSYPNTDIILLCFTINEPHALSNIEEKWVDEIRRYLDGVDVVLVGNMSDLRDDPGQRQEDMISTQEAEEFAERMGALKYFECSAKTGEGVKELFEFVAMNSIIKSRSRAQNRR
ncbi:ras family GTP-binding protein Rho1p, partial [Rhizodiscina lignyota]